MVAGDRSRADLAVGRDDVSGGQCGAAERDEQRHAGDDHRWARSKTGLLHLLSCLKVIKGPSRWRRKRPSCPNQPFGILPVQIDTSRHALEPIAAGPSRECSRRSVAHLLFAQSKRWALRPQPGSFEGFRAIQEVLLADDEAPSQRKELEHGLTHPHPATGAMSALVGRDEKS